MTIPRDGACLLDGQVEELAPSGEAAPSGIPLEAQTIVWTPMGKDEREAYERLHGYPPPGYRATGAVEWFRRSHPDTAPCACGVVTDRWHLRATYIGTGGLPSATYHDHALCGVMVAVCVDCTRRASIAVLEQRQGNLEIAESVRVREAIYLAELKAKSQQEAA